MKYLIDTCVISELSKTRPNPKISGWVSQNQESFLCLSVLTIGELEMRIARLSDTNKKNRLQKWVDEDLRSRFENRILSISEQVASRWGQISGEAEKKGSPVPVIDSLLAATAIVNSLTVVTKNTAHIERAGAPVLNPWV